MKSSYNIINRIIERRLHQSDIMDMLNYLDIQEREKFFSKVTDLLSKFTALLEVTRTISDILDLDPLMSRIVQISMETINVDQGFLFLHDNETGELFCRTGQGECKGEIRISRKSGLTGKVFETGEALIVNNVDSDNAYDKDVDETDGSVTRNILCAPIRGKAGDIIGVLRLINKKNGDFSDDDLLLLEAITTQASAALQNAKLFHKVQRAKEDETQLLEITASFSSELQLKPLLAKVMVTTANMLDAERSTLFLYDEKTDELWSQVALGESKELRIPSRAGIAGTVFHSREIINIPDAYSDARFNPEVDKKTGYVTRNILTVPVNNKEGKTIGVVQVLNKKGGPFTKVDEDWLWAFSTQASTAIENAKLFDEVLDMKNYNESILESLTNGVVSLNSAHIVVKCNSAALRILGVSDDGIMGRYIGELISHAGNEWLMDNLDLVVKTGKPYVAMDTEIVLRDKRKVATNMMIVPLVNIKNEAIGSVLVFEDLTNEKRLKSTMARYMTKEVAEKLLLAGDTMLGGQLQEATVLFSDIRSFTTISEKMGAHETVRLLNEYFTLMVDIIFRYGGVLDKYIGDAIMAVYGAPFTSGEDEDRAVTAAIEMLRELKNYNKRRMHEGKDIIKIGIGINTDEVVAGNIGSIKRMDYTVIGDGVNLASRLERANKYYGTGILLSEFTFRQLKNRYIYREVDYLRVKGKDKPVNVYEILDYHDDSSFINLKDTLELYHEGLSLYRQAKWKESIKKLEKAHSLNKRDRICRIYLDRCRYFLSNPPNENWEGVWTMQEK